MAGFAARTEPSTGVHDPLTVRALAVDDTCWITVDVCGLHEDTCTRIARGLPFMPERVAITATHTHAGPCVMPGRLGGHDPGLLEEIVVACHEAAETAVGLPAACHLAIRRIARSGHCQEPTPSRTCRGPARPSRHIQRRKRTSACLDPALSVPPGGPGSGKPAHQRRLSGVHQEGPGGTFPGSVALFLPGTAGDINSGHPADASYSLSGSAGRTMEQARKIGEHVAASVLGTRAPAGLRFRGRPPPPGGPSASQ